jgi:hypothetical protein
MGSRAPRRHNAGVDSVFQKSRPTVGAIAIALIVATLVACGPMRHNDFHRSFLPP